MVLVGSWWLGWLWVAVYSCGCVIDVPWEADDLRDKPNERKKMFSAFEGALQALELPYVILSGSKTERLKNAVKHINQLLIPQI